MESEKTIKNREQEDSLLREQKTRAKEAQVKAISDLLYNFGNRARKCENLSQLNDLASNQALALCNMINASTTAALISLHSAIKGAVAESINKTLDDSGRVIIDEFRNNVLH